LQGVAVGPDSQLTHLASIRAMVVFPVPLGPHRRMAWASLSEVNALDSALVICS
jgi:hypothetical protein